VKSGSLRLEELPEALQEGILGVVEKGKRREPEITRGEVLVAAARVMDALRKSQAPPEQWYRILGQCQRWCHNPKRLHTRRRRAK